MLEDKVLVWKFKRGSSDALRRIYEKYKNELLALAITLCQDSSAAEDVVHDVFVSFADFADKIQLRGSLRSYLSVSVANRVRNLSRTRRQQVVELDEAHVVMTASDSPAESAVSAEQTRQISEAMAQLPYPQREVIILHLLSGMKFRVIAESTGASVNTIQSRYRYGLDKLQSMLNSEVRE